MHMPGKVKFLMLIVSACLMAVLCLPRAAISEIYGFDLDDELHMILGELEEIKVTDLTRVSITDPEVADVVDADDQQILIVARGIGETTLFIWDTQGKRTIEIHVVLRDLETVKNRIKKLLRGADIKEVELEKNDKAGRVVLLGEIPEYKFDQFEDVIEPFNEDIISLVKVEEIEDLVQIDIQITELNTTLSKSIGIDWAGGTEDTLLLDYEEDLPDFDGGIDEFFKFGKFSRTSQLIATVNALVEEGKGRILSQPKLVVVSGEEASFLVGGEIPIRTTTSTTSGATQENVEFKEYGIGMTITPLLRKGKIDILLNVEVSDIDAANAVGDDVAFTTRSASTQLVLDDGQTIVLAGLIKQQESETVKRVPFLSEVPIFGLLFRKRSTITPNQDQELVFSITPHRILQKKDRDEEDLQEKRRIYSKTTKFAPSFRMQIPNEMRDYVRGLQHQISQSIVYPREAELYGWEGTVTVGLHILSDGTLAFAMVKESSGHDIIDEYALTTAQKVAPYSNFPSNTDLQELKVTIPIIYSLNR